ncbi:Uncharacterised protein [Mycobacteroides abscessus subsp. massiliense]|uniref:hypothetical protein n=1 Tax=Mycobacteroides abscessus TaxID=36809 RepID=UPI0009A8F961|nr:hypothetical protein [Mycobacteroides abscessus]SKM81027.1 Uncharacterised protein [Mycobacteroides abscessus subsp. massiliense]SKM97404.1 Uncharacterised protein [Mycobacteroides abscessus subsp. massiliense]SKN76362.1 Uncharacterised protein [Mycobacteroides abscessus subsp. massiliense]SKN96759.1 Uncharacterised protein [Mycobacteroides abscessus subsp. massiliense]SKO21027.1 Uncharacterised protein [Mycobacteroides abscessus subsp. massiliense]
MGLYPPILSPDVQALARIFLKGRTEITVPIGTRVRPTPANRTKPSQILQLEDGGGHQLNPLEFSRSVIMHSYDPDEVAASLTSRTATALLVAARGDTVDGWFVSFANADILPHSLNDPDVPNVPRYRSMVTWIVQGQPIGSPITP